VNVGLIWLELTCLYDIISCLFIGDGKGSYILQNIGSSSSETGSKKAIKAKYSIALQYLVLEETSN
jgi:hypothetical protein